MIQIIQRREDPSVRIGQQLGGILQAGIQGYQSGVESAALAKERQAFKEQFGMDLSRDPAIAKVQMAEALKGKREQDRFKSFMDYVNRKKGKPTSNLETRESDEQDTLGTPTEDIQTDDDIDPMEKYILGQIDPMFGQFAAKDEAEARADRRAAKKLDLQNKQFEETKKQKEAEMFHKETKEYYKKLHEDAKVARDANLSLSQQERLVDQLDWRDRAASLLKPEIRNILQSDSAVEFDSYVTNLLGSKKTKLGGVLTTPKLNLLYQKLATSGKSKETNKAILKYNKLENDMIIAEAEIADQIMHENKGYRPPNFIAMVNERLKNLFQDRADSLYNDVQKLPDDPERLKKVWRKKVPQGTPLTQEIADKYIEMFGEKEAPIKAEEDGWIFRK